VADVDSRQGARYSTPGILAFVERWHAPHDAPLARAFAAPEREGLPAIQLGPQEGGLLELLVRLSGARRAVEIGTLAGYSALRIARALPEAGLLVTIDRDPKAAAVSRRAFADSPWDSRIRLLEGDAAEVLAGLASEGPFDLVCVDADKERYDLYGRWAAANLRLGGLLVADNVYLFGRLLEESAEAAAMRRFHEEAARAFDTVCVPTPDGLLVGVKR
jgi:caffeoyl-CoA O-methyltransferase